MTANPAPSPPQQSDHAPVGDKPAARCTRQVLGGTILVLVGVCVAAYFTIGTLFMARAVRQRDPSVGWMDVGLGLQLALGGAGLFATGIYLVAVRRKTTASTPPPLAVSFPWPARREACP